MDLEYLTATILIVIGAASSLTPLILGYLQARGNQPTQKASREKTLSESWQLFVNELQEEMGQMKSERTVFINGMADLNKRVGQLEDELRAKDEELQEAHRQAAIKEKSLQATINGLNDKISDLENKINGRIDKLKIKTDELKKQTGELKSEIEKTKDE